ncbi:MAG: aminomethyl-transferring glycine dehydrogenase subunit GcvPA [Thermotogota bacterium]|nr:aminomethyl-transferring glycine dehydrogenase subunit GcvPA [Thermotogota bacterium]
MKNNVFKHPYIPNSSHEVIKEMLTSIGANTIEELYEEIPEELKFKGTLDFPDPLVSEVDLEREIKGILKKNENCEDNLNFIGGGTYNHYVPAIVDEIINRSEFLTAYAGEPYEDHGRFQALFEYQSLMAELLDVEVVNIPTFDGAQAAATSLRMAERITKRKKILVSDSVSPERMLVINNYCTPALEIEWVHHDKKTGEIDINDLKNKLSNEIAGFYFENPSFFGIFQHNPREISRLVHDYQALLIIGVEPNSLGLFSPPHQYGADIVCGDLQSLGIHMHTGGGLAGFIGTMDDPKFVMEYPSRLFGVARNEKYGEWGFGDVAYDRTSFAHREKGKEFVGTAAALWGIAAGVYLALMGPEGLYQLGKTIREKNYYAATQISKIKGIKANPNDSLLYREFLVDFQETGLEVETINKRLKESGIFGGLDLHKYYLNHLHILPEVLSQWEKELNGKCLFCITENHTKKDIDQLIKALSDIIHTNDQSSEKRGQ